ncbi:MAG: CocE/NonD family hydrolase [Actinophytocola sp.]|uniref:CocE/NonD family hydrolase n=1 Tax=Actinophytocola sp. TaxID=1872138 RepID=UPI003C766D2F
MRNLRTACVLAAAIALTGALAGPAAAAAPPATGSDPITHEQNDRVPEGGAWTQHYFPSSDGSGAELHADVLLPEDLPDGEKVPVILSVGPYFSHAGDLAPKDWTHTGPSDRFDEFIEGTDLFARGYAFVRVDLRGFGGSTGCLDFVGDGEQADVKAAIDWAASQPWSTGAVGMYGKSYDAITGLVGNNLNQDALKAVVAQEPIWDPYRDIRSNGVPRTTIVGISTFYNGLVMMPQLPDDDARYLANSRYEETHLECLADNIAGYQTADQESEYWQTRDLAKRAEGTDTPLLFTQGFLEWNTEPEGMQEYLDNHEGPERGWLGPWDHVRGDDVLADGRLAMGRTGWYEETMSFYDQYLKGIEPSVEYPAYAIQDSTGTWRAQDTWPVVERSAALRLDGGSYVDHGGEAESRASFFQRSEPLKKATRITGTPKLSVNAKGNGNVMVKLYDVAPDGKAVMFDEQVSVLSSGRTAFDLRSADWTLAAGHVLAVEIGTIQAGPHSDWIDTPSRETIKVRDARLDLALDDPADDTATEGARAPYLDDYLGLYGVELPAGPATFTVPAVR